MPIARGRTSVGHVAMTDILSRKSLREDVFPVASSPARSCSL